MTEAEREKQGEAIIATALEALREHGFTSCILAASRFDNESELTFTHRQGFGDWYARRGLSEWLADYHRQNDALPIKVENVSREA